MAITDVPALAGVHHLKLPVTDLARSLEWYRSRLGYDIQVEFVEQGTLMGYSLAHPAGGPNLGLRLDPDRARAAAGFDYFAIGVPDKAALDQLARKLDDLGQAHAGVHRASRGWILPEVLDPDGHALRFYSMEHHTVLQPGDTTTIHDPRESAERREEADRHAEADRHGEADATGRVTATRKLSAAQRPGSARTPSRARDACAPLARRSPPVSGPRRVHRSAAASGTSGVSPGARPVADNRKDGAPW